MTEVCARIAYVYRHCSRCRGQFFYQRDKITERRHEALLDSFGIGISAKGLCDLYPLILLTIKGYRLHLCTHITLWSTFLRAFFLLELADQLSGLRRIVELSTHAVDQFLVEQGWSG